MGWVLFSVASCAYLAVVSGLMNVHVLRCKVLLVWAEME